MTSRRSILLAGSGALLLALLLALLCLVAIPDETDASVTTAGGANEDRATSTEATGVQGKVR